ncbi:MAG: signal peptidase I [Lachnospiraceae bacterium]|nr:signal peptidase I [Lachnospiraceae bacterium]
MTKTIRRIWNAITTVIVIAAVLLAAAFVGVRLIGFQVFTVLSGSMEPTYLTGSLIYVKSVDYTELEPGDVITFLLDEDTVATHRIVEVLPDEEDPAVLRYRTKGDANDVEDGGLVHYRNVIGTPVFTIPYLGYVAAYIQSPPGTYVAIAAGAILILLVFLPDLFSSDDDEKKQKDEKKQRDSIPILGQAEEASKI